MTRAPAPARIEAAGSGGTVHVDTVLAVVSLSTRSRRWLLRRAQRQGTHAVRNTQCTRARKAHHAQAAFLGSRAGGPSGDTGGGARRRAGPFTLSGCRQQRRERSHDFRDGRAARRARSHGHPHRRSALGPPAALPRTLPRSPGRRGRAPRAARLVAPRIQVRQRGRLQGLQGGAVAGVQGKVQGYSVQPG